MIGGIMALFLCNQINYNLHNSLIFINLELQDNNNTIYLFIGFWNF